MAGRPHEPARTPRMSVVLSFRNEEDTLPEFIARIRATLGAEQARGRIRDWELIFVDDDSTDGSRALLERASEGHEDIRILTTSRRFGVSQCVLAGMAHSTGEILVYMDCDLQDPPEVVSDMLSAWSDSDKVVDVVHTRRLSRAGESKLKLFITSIGYWTLNKLADITLPPHVGDFKLLSRRAVEAVLAFDERRPYLRGLVCWIGFEQVVVPYHRHARFGGETKFPVLSAAVIRNFLDSALISFSDAPIRLAALLGILISAVALLGAIGIVVAALVGVPIEGWWLVLLAVLFLGGSNMIFTGILGLYVSAIHVESRGRPNYIIRDRFGFGSNSAS